MIGRSTCFSNTNGEKEENKHSARSGERQDHGVARPNPMTRWSSCRVGWLFDLPIAAGCLTSFTCTDQLENRCNMTFRVIWASIRSPCDICTSQIACEKHLDGGKTKSHWLGYGFLVLLLLLLDESHTENSQDGRQASEWAAPPVPLRRLRRLTLPLSAYCLPLDLGVPLTKIIFQIINLKYIFRTQVITFP